MSQDKPYKGKIWEIEFTTPKFSKKFKTSDMCARNRTLAKIRKLYMADEIYFSGKNDIVCYYKVVVGKFKSKRLDGVKV